MKIPESEQKLVAWWKFDESKGANAVDSSGNEITGIFTGEPQWLPTGGKTGGALQFDGVDDYVDTTFSGNLPVWTITAWVNGTAAPASEGPSGPIHWQKNLQINWDHQDENYRGAAGTQVAGRWYAASFEDLQPKTWYHLAATFDGESLKAYKDGVLITKTPTNIGNSDAESESLKLGRHASFSNSDNYFGGIVDDIRIYNYSLSADDIAAVHAGKELPGADKPEVLATSTEFRTNLLMIPVLIAGLICITVIAVILILLSTRMRKSQV